jgi:hypothetical protein
MLFRNKYLIQYYIIFHDAWRRKEDVRERGLSFYNYKTTYHPLYKLFSSYSQCHCFFYAQIKGLLSYYGANKNTIYYIIWSSVLNQLCTKHMLNYKLLADPKDLIVSLLCGSGWRGHIYYRASDAVVVVPCHELQPSRHTVCVRSGSAATA